MLKAIKRRIKRKYIDALMLNQFESVSLREIFAKSHGVEVGMYTYGCFDETRFPRGTVIGRYCSFAKTAHVFNGNHGLNFLSMHPYLYNPTLGLVESETIVRKACLIEDDVWCGHSSIILPSATTIGRGSVIAAGAVVTKDVPRYAVVAGNPAKIIKFRFDERVIENIEESKWWLLDKDDIRTILKLDPAILYSPSAIPNLPEKIAAALTFQRA